MVPLKKHAPSPSAGDSLADKERKQRVHIADEITNTEREYYKDLDFTIIVSSLLQYFLMCIAQSNSFRFLFSVFLSVLFFRYRSFFLFLYLFVFSLF